MKIVTDTVFEASNVGRYRTVITAKIMTDDGTVLCEGEDSDAWPDPNLRRATAQAATLEALEKFERMIATARDVAKKSGLL